MNIFKRIWNYIERKFDSLWNAFTDESILAAEANLKRLDAELSTLDKKPNTKEVSAPVFYFPSHKMTFNKQQLAGKIITDGKDRFKVHELIAVGNKFKYYIEVLI